MIIRELSSKECGEALNAASFGRLGCARDNQPYVVPIFFATDEDFICSFALPGQKIDWMRENRQICLQFDNYSSGGDWTSVVVFGQFAELIDTDERERAHALLQARPMWWEPGAISPAGRDDTVGNTPIFYRISKTSMTGYRYSSPPGEKVR
ncbi:MAG TPA: pyridoxamine 5'-phosphate oxidase family protein [Polyangiaceae bacterium]|nr:pyridoxamine 5'-phosphate oxidase family protein [Polyangiaceae bacterium]